MRKFDFKILLQPQYSQPIAVILVGIMISLAIFFSSGSEISLRSDSSPVKASEDETEKTLDCEGDNRLDMECFTEFASTLDLDVEQFTQCVENGKHENTVFDELTYGGKIGIGGTPSLYVAKGSAKSMRGFLLGNTGYQDLVNIIKYARNHSISETRDWYKDIQLQVATAYRSQIRDFYASPDGGSLKGKALDKKVQETIEMRRNDVLQSTQLIDLKQGKGIVKGKGDVILMEFSDYECPYCQQFSQEVLPDLNKNYINKGIVKYIFRDFPLESIHPKARGAAEAVRCAGDQGKYFEFHDLVFAI